MSLAGQQWRHDRHVFIYESIYQMIVVLDMSPENNAGLEPEMVGVVV